MIATEIDGVLQTTMKNLFQLIPTDVGLLIQDTNTIAVGHGPTAANERGLQNLFKSSDNSMPDSLSTTFSTHFVLNITISSYTLPKW